MIAYSPGWPPIYVAEFKFELLGLLFAALKCWDHRHAPPCECVWCWRWIAGPHAC